MRFLLIPHIGLHKIDSDSNFLLYLDLARFLASKGHYSFILMPKFASELLRDREERGIKYMVGNDAHGFYDDANVVDDRFMVEMFSKHGGKYITDVVITSKAAIIPYLQVLLSDYEHCKNIPCFHIEPGVTDTEGHNYFEGDSRLMLVSAGYVYGTPVFLTDYERARAARLASKFFSPYRISQMMRKAIVTSVGVHCAVLDELIRDIPKRERFTLFYGGRLNRTKRPERIIEVYDKFFSYGRDLDIVVTTGTRKSTFCKQWGEITKGRPNINVRFQCPREEYLRIATSCHAFIVWSVSEAFPVGFWEQMYMGLIGLFPKTNWAVKQLPEGYPWIFSSKTEAYAMLKEIYDDYPGAVSRTAWIRDYIRENHDAGAVYERILENAIVQMNAKHTYRIGRGAKQLLEEVLENDMVGDEFRLIEVLKGMEKRGDTFKADLAERMRTMVTIHYYPNNYDVYRELLNMGYVDICQDEEPMFRRGKQSVPRAEQAEREKV